MTITLHPVDAVDTDSDGVPDFPTYTGQHLRQVLSAIIGGSTAARPLGSFTGVSPGTPTNTVTASSTTWTIKPHAGVMDVETPVASGPYFYAIDANLTGPVTAANATNPRIDLLSLQLSDPAMADGSTVPGLAAVYTTGTASASPSAPAAPARSLVLAQITVPASGGGAPTVTWVAPYLAAAGGILPCASSAAYPAPPYVGQYVDDATLGLLRWNGTQWIAPAPPSPAWNPITGLTTGANAGSPVPQYSVWANGQVELSGQVVASSTFATGGVALFTLPLGARPASGQAPHIFPAAWGGTATQPPTVRVDAAGVVTLFAVAGCANFYLDTVRFRTN